MTLFLLAVIMFVNYTVDKEKFLFAYRFDIGGLPINILDLLIAAATIAAMLRVSKQRYPGETTHRAYKWTVGLLTLSCFTGAFGSFINNVAFRDLAETARNVATLALSVFIGYYAISTMRQAKWAGYILLLSSAASALFVLLFVRETAETLSWMSSSFNQLRSNNRGGDAGVVCAGVLACAVVSRFRIVPTLLVFPMFALSMLGSFALPHRSIWLSAIVTLLFAVLVLPSVRIGRKFGAAVLLGPLMAGILISGVLVYSQLTGRNFVEYIDVRFRSMLPGVEELKDNRPWETRLPGIFAELKMWSESPIIGKGFWYQTVYGKQTGEDVGYRHNVWSSALAEGGLPLFLGYLIPCIALMVVGKRMVNVRMDRATVLMGMIGALQGIMCLMHASTTMSINTQREGIPFGLIFGLLLRTRAMQLAVAHEHEGYFSPEDLENREYALSGAAYA